LQLLQLVVRQRDVLEAAEARVHAVHSLSKQAKRLADRRDGHRRAQQACAPCHSQWHAK
jgi:cytochrome c2